jgi:hypothetical protein
VGDADATFYTYGVRKRRDFELVLTRIWDVSRPDESSEDTIVGSYALSELVRKHMSTDRCSTWKTDISGASGPVESSTTVVARFYPDFQGEHDAEAKINAHMSGMFSRFIERGGGTSWRSYRCSQLDIMGSSAQNRSRERMAYHICRIQRVVDAVSNILFVV